MTVAYIKVVLPQKRLKTAKKRQNLRFTGEIFFLCIRYIFLAHFGKIKKKILGTVVSQSQKPRNLPLKGQKTAKTAKNVQNKIFTGEKMVLYNR